MPTPRQLQFDLRPSYVVLRLLIINAAIFALVALLGERTERLVVRPYLMLTPGQTLGDLFVWQPFTYMWLHEGFSHLFFNMLALFFLGPPLERRWGRRTFLKFYLLTGIMAGVFSVLVGVVVGSFYWVPILGASGAILALVAAWSMVLPNTQILLFFVLPVRTRYVVWIALGIDLVFFFSSAGDATRVAVQTHIGGALAGWLLITGNWRPRVAWFRLNQLIHKWRGGGPRPPSKRKTNLRVIKGGRDDDRTLH
ncbi:MAG: rhomboid family intramembrane serine protease [Deltaproteobacteria bacterium]|nr:MAG: rhomboid family intramembrane serine protease [Deltaproteobacteria bacterium]